MEKILKKKLVLFNNDDPFEKKLFVLVGIMGMVASFSSGTLYVLLPRHVVTGIICYGAGIATIFLIWYVKKAKNPLPAYLITIFGVFIGLFITLFFSFGANSGYLFVIGLAFSSMLLSGKQLYILLPFQALCYLAAIMYSYYHSEMVHFISSPEKNLQLLVIGCLGCSSIICPSIAIYKNTYVKAMKLANEASEEAIEASKAKDRFLASMSHEIRTPINTILGMNDIIERESDGSVSKYTGDIRTSGQELLEIIDNILDYSRMGAGKEEVHEIVYSTQTLFNKWKFTGESLAGKKHLQFSISAPENFPAYLTGDVAKINRIVLNLITNAIKYTDYGSVKVELVIDSISEKKVTYSVKVIDTGKGIKKEDLEHLFGSFERFDQEKNYKIQGTGLGLAISRGLAEVMNASLTCESTYDVGSVFTLKITQKISREEDYSLGQIDTVVLKKSIHAPKAHILVVDDTESNRNVISLLLKHSGIKIDMAESGVEAISRYKANKYDAVLMDYRMSGLNGVETLERLRLIDEGEGVHTPVIVVTADVLEDTMDRLLEAGFDDYISKPVNEPTLAQVLLKHLPKDLAIEVDMVSDSNEITFKPKKVVSFGSKILIVDDDSRMHDIAGSICENAGYEVERAESCAECIDILKKEATDRDLLPSLILLDVNMPGSDGFATFNRIKQIPECEYIPVVFMTSETSIEVEVMCMEAGAADFIMKPFVKDIMLSRIAHHIEKANNLKAEIENGHQNAVYDPDKLALVESKLTPTEVLVAKLIAEGFSNQEIADKTNYSYAYIKKVGSNIFGKLEITKRSELRNMLK